mmetsp:Transcript_24694/g.57511  ORF Transcript_24694/g.57511 Transcript_24694/m.57511 type:complete len:486 (-) Transcript_24694:2193-3650(-)
MHDRMPPHRLLTDVNAPPCLGPARLPPGLCPTRAQPGARGSPRGDAVRLNGRLDVHRRELIGKVLENVRDSQHINVRAIGALAAVRRPAGLLDAHRARRQHHRRQERAALGAHECLSFVGAAQQPVLHEESDAVREKRVSLHLSQSDAAVHLPSMDGLPCERVDGPFCAHLVLIGHHVPEPLIVDDAKEDLHLHLGAIDARVHALRPMVCVPRRAQLLAEEVDRAVLLGELEGRRVLPDAMQRARLARHRLEKHADRHARGKAVRVEEDVWREARLTEGHVLRRPQPRQDALLPVPRRELVAGHRVSHLAQLDEDARQRRARVRRVAAHQPHLLDNRRLGALVQLHRVPAGHLVEDDAQRVELVEPLANLGQPVWAEAPLKGAALVRLGHVVGHDVGEAEAWLLAAPVQVVQVDRLGEADRAVAEAAVVRRLVDDHRVLHVVAGVRDHRHDRVSPERVVVEAVEVVVAVAHDGRLRREHVVRLGV